MRSLLLCVALIPALYAPAQKTVQIFDYSFKPAARELARYRVTTEQEDTLWHRTAVYHPEKTPAMEGWYLDKDCTIEHGPVTWYFPSGGLLTQGRYVNGKKEGTWKRYHENGVVRDSAFYAGGQLAGTRLRWHENGSLADSTVVDPAGGVTRVWLRHSVYASVYWTPDTTRQGRWMYYYPNGQLQAIEDYADGKPTPVSCFDSTGQQLQDCGTRKAAFAGGEEGWRKFLERNLNPSVPIDAGAPTGAYTVLVQFIVGKDGVLSEIKPLTDYGYGMEAELERLMQQSPRWEAAHLFGRTVKAYYIQPVTFVVTEGRRSRKLRETLGEN